MAGSAPAIRARWTRTATSSITGRLKEIINRGGEKISPREVDEIIMEHPAVHQCVTFGMPHEMLGEEVAAAIVLKEGAACDDRELRQFAAGEARGLQGAEEDPDPEGDPGRRDGEAAADRTGAEARTRLTNRRLIDTSTRA